jgi:hypothetical protein
MAQLCYVAPTAWVSSVPTRRTSTSPTPAWRAGNLGIGGYGATNGTCYGLDDKSTKIVYFSPNFAGFSFAASFTPDGTEDTATR